MDNNVEVGKDGRKDEDGRQANLCESFTKLKLQAFNLAALGMILGDIVVKVTSMMQRSSIQIAT